MLKGLYDKDGNNDFIITNNKTIDITEYTKNMNIICGSFICLDNNKIIIEKESNDLIFGTLCLHSKVTYGTTKSGTVRRKFIPHNSKYPEFIVGSKKQSQSCGAYVSIKFEKWEINQPIGIIVDYFGDIGNIETEKNFYKRYLTCNWKKNIILKNTISNYLNDITPNRIDLTNNYIISVDPKGCVDIDDAFHIEKVENNYIIGIHIADVSSYILENSEMDIEIKKRSESIYLNKSQYNMIPDELSLNYISLKKNKISRAYSLILNIDTNGDIIKYDFKKSLIKVAENMSYEEVDVILKNKSNSSIVELYNIINKIYKKKKNIQYIENYDSHKLIELLMILTNYYAGMELFKKYKNNALMRKHKGCKNSDNKDSIINLYNMEKAEYCFAEGDFKHNGLEEEYYTHFTSPIRRYADIIVHRMLYGNYKTNNYDIYNMNLVQKKINKIQREYDTVEKLFELKEIKETCITSGQIIGIKNKLILVKLDKLNIDVEIDLIPNKLKNVVKIIKDLANVITIENIETQKNITFKLLQQVEVIIGLTMKLNKKINCKIINPDTINIYHNFYL
jgi:exoribonuclease R